MQSYLKLRFDLLSAALERRLSHLSKALGPHSVLLLLLAVAAVYRASLGGGFLQYLPIRDLSCWLDVHAFGLWPQDMRIVNLAWYLGAVQLIRAALLRSFKNRLLAETAAWCCALHPIHAESAAWPASRKDVLAMLFLGAGLWGRYCCGTGRYPCIRRD